MADFLKIRRAVGGPGIEPEASWTMVLDDMLTPPCSSSLLSIAVNAFWLLLSLRLLIFLESDDRDYVVLSFLCFVFGG